MTTRAEKKMTKRQRRMQGPNPANTWQQQPNLKSSAARAKAYLLDAGLHKSSSTSTSKSQGKKPTAEDLLDPKLDLNSPEVKFGRMLGGTDQRARHKAVAKLREYFRARCDIRNADGGVSELDMMKLWKVRVVSFRAMKSVLYRYAPMHFFTYIYSTNLLHHFTLSDESTR